MSAAADQPHFGLIVEGPGDHGAVPILIRRILSECGEYRDVLATPLSAKGLGNLTTTGGIEKFAGIAAARPGCVAVLVVVDSDGECVVEVSDSLRARTAHLRVPTYFFLAEKNFESWLYASAETLDIGIAYDSSHSGVAEIRRALLPEAYSKPVHQPRLAARMDLSVAANRSASLKRLVDRVVRHVEAHFD